MFDPQTFVGGGAALPRYTSTSHYSNVQWTTSRHPSPRPRAAAKKAGLHYERKVLDVLTAIYGDAFTPQPAIRYIAKGRPQLAILDGLLTLPDVTIIIEVKLSHTEKVWEQLMERYFKLVRALESTVPLRTVEICRSYDPAVLLPGPHTKIDSLHRCRGGLEVLQWRI